MLFRSDNVSIGGVDVAIADTTTNDTLEEQFAVWMADAASQTLRNAYDITLNAAKDGVVFTAKTAGAIGGDGPAAAPGGGATETTAGADATTATPGTDTTDATFQVFGKTLNLATIAPGTVKGADLAKLVADAWNAQAADDKKLDNVDVTATVEGNKVVFTMAKAPSSHTDVAATTGGFGGTNLAQNNGHEITVTVEQDAVGEAGRLYGQSSMTLTDDDIVDGRTLKIGDTTYIFAVGADSKYKGAANVVDLTDKKAGTTGIVADAAKRLSTAAKDNKNFKVGTTTTTGVITFTEREGGVDYSKNNLAGDDGKGTTDLTNPATGATKDADADDWKGLIMMGMADVNASSHALTLQIGDTADDFNKMSVSVDDMSAKGLGLDGLRKVGIMTETEDRKSVV